MYLARVPGPGAAGNVCGAQIRKDYLSGDKVTSSLVLKSLTWPAGSKLNVEIQ